MVEIPHELAVLRELHDAVLRGGSRHPNESLMVDDYGLQRRGPEGMVARPSPGVGHSAFLIQFDEFRPPNAAVNPVVFSSDFIRIRLRRTIQEPDVIVLVDENSGHLLHAPSIGQGLWPEWI